MMRKHPVRFADPLPVEDLTPVPLTRAQVKGWIRWSFWGLRLYILVMLVLVVIGFMRGI